MAAATETTLHSGDYPPTTKVEVKTLADGRVRVIVRGPKTPPHT